MNKLNQYSERTVPNYVDILGIANPTTPVKVNGNTAYRKGDYFQYALQVDNSSAPQYPSITVSNSYPPGATNTGNLYVPKTSECFTNDADGNLTTDGRWKFTWDAENRLVAMTNNASVPDAARMALVFAYDWQGRRISKTVYTNNAGNYVISYSQEFVYDGWNLIATLTSDLRLLTSFTRGLDLSGSLQGAAGVGGLLFLSQISNPEISNFVSFDGNGNAVGLTSAADGVPLAQYEYGPFGEVVRATYANPLVRQSLGGGGFRFSTKYQDDETDIVMYPRRPWRDGRFLSRDPSAELSAQPATPLPVMYSDTELTDADEPDGNSVPDFQTVVRPAYRFVDNDPINHFDPLGENIYLQRGNGTITPNRWLHLGVCVDMWHCAQGGWQKTGKACFSFAMTGFRASMPSNKWLGWSEWNIGGPLEGQIYQQSYLTGTVVAQRTTTMRQDLTWYMYMLVTRKGTADTYSLARHNCRRYSKYEYRDAPLYMGPP